MVARHGELSMFFLDNEVVERFLLRELIAQAHTIVIDTETNGDVALGRSLVQVDLHLIVVVADGGSLSPYRFPSLIKGGSLAAGLGETVHQVSLLHAFAGMLVLCQLQTEMGWLDDCLSLVGHLVGCPLSLKENVRLTLPLGDFTVWAAANIGSNRPINKTLNFFIFLVIISYNTPD